MSSATLVALFAILGTGLAVTSTACLVLWRKVRALTPVTSGSKLPQTVSGQGITVALPGFEAQKRPSKVRSEFARRLNDLETRFARIEAATTEAALAIVSRGADPKLSRRVDPGASATSEGPTLISVPNLASPPSSTSEAASELDRRFGPIWGMADEGASTEAIARETGYPIGQVELILGLRRQLLVAATGPGAALDD